MSRCDYSRCDEKLEVDRVVAQGISGCVLMVALVAMGLVVCGNFDEI